MTADEKLEGMRERYGNKWDVFWTQPPGEEVSICVANRLGGPKDLGLVVDSRDVDALADALAKLTRPEPPKRITAKMLADLARRKRGCEDAGIGQCGADYYIYVTLTTPERVRDYTKQRWATVPFYYEHYENTDAAMRAAWNFLMERPDKANGAPERSADSPTGERGW